MVKVTGGDKLGPALAALAKKLSSATSLQVGFMEDATYPDGTSVAAVASYQEWGAPKVGIPPRPFFRTMIAKQSPGWGKLIGAALVATDFDAEKALGQAGEVIKAQLQQSIVDTSSPPLSPVTVMLRGMRTQARYRDLPFGELIAEARSRVEAGKTNYGASDKPLNDTDRMFASVTAKVE